MVAKISESIVVRRPLSDVAPVATDPHVLLPLIAGLGRFAFIADDPDGSQQWDMFLDIGAIHVGGRVRVLTDGRVLTWQSERGTRHTMRVEVTEDEAGAEVSMRMDVQLGGLLLGRAAEFIARGIAGRHLVAGLEQLRHHLEFGPGKE